MYLALHLNANFRILSQQMHKARGKSFVSKNPEFTKCCLEKEVEPYARSHYFGTGQ